MAIDLAQAAFKRDGKTVGVATGFTDLDKKLGGLHPSDLVILAGRPSMGKTALATNIAFNAAKAYRSTRGPDGRIRYANAGALVDRELVYGVSFNNNPTVNDVWNSTSTTAVCALRPSLAVAMVGSLPAVLRVLRLRRAERLLGWAHWPCLHALDNRERHHKETPRDD